MNEGETILIVDDSDNDLQLMRMAFEWAKLRNPMQALHNGNEAIAYFKGEGPYSARDKHPLPSIMLLDLNMPMTNGFEVLEWVRSQSILRRLPIIVLSASARVEDVERAFDLGANSFLVKPPTMEELIGMMRCLRDWLLINHFAPPAVG